MIDWGAIVSNAIITAGTVTVAWFGLRGKLAELSKDTQVAKKQAAAAAAASTKTEQSINGRDSPASDRWDEIHGDVKSALDKIQGLQRDVTGVRQDHQTTRKELGILHGEDRATRADVQQIRADLTKHLQDSEPLMPMLQDLHQRYANGRAKNPEGPQL